MINRADHLIGGEVLIGHQVDDMYLTLVRLDESWHILATLR
jgi:hypothetical protein